MRQREPGDDDDIDDRGSTPAPPLDNEDGFALVTLNQILTEFHLQAMRAFDGKRSRISDLIRRGAATRR